MQSCLQVLMKNMSHPAGVFSGYRWSYYHSLEGQLRSRADSFLASVNWDALKKYASDKRNGAACKILPEIGLGYNHMVRILVFEDDIRWVARLRMPPVENTDLSTDTENSSASKEKCEYNAMTLVRQSTSIPVPSIHAIEAQTNINVNASFMLMDCIPGNIGMDLGMKIPPTYKQSFLRNLARIHVQLSMVKLPKIGTIISRDADGTYNQGPIPGLGGPFDTATKFFEAWAAKTKFSKTPEEIRAQSGQYADEIINSVALFPSYISNTASILSVHDHGPFPLCHGDFGHNNTIVDDEYRILSLIDWEGAFAAPWEIFASFPLLITVIPQSIDAPWNYNAQGEPVSQELVEQLQDQDYYMSAVKEEEMGECNYLSQTLQDLGRRELTTAMSYFQNGKLAWYSNLIGKLDVISHNP
ncbi:hypothetical protein BX600DRAFT_70107 [Xylariales sp. PMI_506]|nr:hypothetical protein BX600DRAFT_70107 [Xylariales sp. PMI_506]